MTSQLQDRTERNYTVPSQDIALHHRTITQRDFTKQLQNTIKVYTLTADLIIQYLTKTYNLIISAIEEIIFTS